MKATEHYFPVVLLMMLCKVVLTFESVHKVLYYASSKGGSDSNGSGFWLVESDHVPEELPVTSLPVEARWPSGKKDRGLTDVICRWPSGKKGSRAHWKSRDLGNHWPSGKGDRGLTNRWRNAGAKSKVQVGQRGWSLEWKHRKKLNTFYCHTFSQ